MADIRCCLFVHSFQCKKSFKRLLSSNRLQFFILFLALRSLSAIADSTIIIIAPTMISDFFVGMLALVRLQHVVLSFFRKTSVIRANNLLHVHFCWNVSNLQNLPATCFAYEEGLCMNTVYFSSIGLVVGTIFIQIQADWQWSLRIVPIFGLPVMILSTIFLKVRRIFQSNNRLIFRSPPEERWKRK